MTPCESRLRKGLGCWIVIAAFAVGVTARVGLVLRSTSEPVALDSDAVSYVSLAKNLLAGEGFRDTSPNLGEDFPGPQPTSFWSPLYPLIMAPLLAAGDDAGFLAIKLVNVLFSMLTAGLLLRMGNQTFGWPTGQLASIGYCVYPAAVYHCNAVMPESLTALLVTLLAFQVYQFENAAGIYRALVLGGALGLAVLTNGVVLSFTLAIAIFLWLNRFRFGRHWREVLLAIVATVSVVTPWGLRNLAVHGEFFVLPTKAGYNLLVGNQAGANGQVSFLRDKYEGRFVAMRELEKDATARKIALELIRDDLLRFVSLMPAKAYHLWTPVPNVVRRPLLIIAQLTSYGVVLLLTLVGIYALRGELRLISLPYLLMATMTAVAMVFFGASRLRFPLEPLMIVVAARTLMHAMIRWTDLVSSESRLESEP